MQWWCVAQDVAWTWEWRAYPGVWLFVGAMALTAWRLLAREATAPPLDEAPGARGATGPTGEGFPRLTRAWFAATGILLLWIALDWPVGALGAGYLASVHMVQFLLIAIAAPPFLLLGVPRARWEALLSRTVPGAVARVLGYPLASLAFFTVVTALTHWPPVVDVLMASQLGNFALDMLWLAGGLVLWWPVAVALPERSWQTEPFKMGYLIAATIADTGVFAYLTFSELPLYATFELAPPVGSLTSRDDQLIAGLLMKIAGGVIFWIAISILFFRWFRRSERESSPAVATTAVLLSALLAPGCAGDGAREDRDALRVPIATISEPVAGDRAALYLRIENPGTVADTLEGVEVEGVGHASLHTTVTEGVTMRMAPADDGLEVPPGGSLRMTPGGTHVMLEGLSTELTRGMLVPIVLRFRHAGEVVDTARVSPITALEEALGGGR